MWILMVGDRIFLGIALKLVTTAFLATCVHFPYADIRYVYVYVDGGYDSNAANIAEEMPKYVR